MTEQAIDKNNYLNIPEESNGTLVVYSVLVFRFPDSIPVPTICVY